MRKFLTVSGRSGVERNTQLEIRTYEDLADELA
jgi:hypothetical protein